RHRPRISASAASSGSVRRKASSGLVQGAAGRLRAIEMWSRQRFALSFLWDAVRVRPSPGLALAVCDGFLLPRFGLDSARNRRYQAAPAAKNAPMSGDRTRADTTTSRVTSAVGGAAT